VFGVTIRLMSDRGLTRLEVGFGPSAAGGARGSAAFGAQQASGVAAVEGLSYRPARSQGGVIRLSNECQTEELGIMRTWRAGTDLAQGGACGGAAGSESGPGSPVIRFPTRCRDGGR
jgi:hypothetical protein